MKKHNIAIIGLGYVGLPLAVALTKHYKVIGFDINEARINELKSGKDSTNEVLTEQLQSAEIQFTSTPQHLSSSTIIIVTVPTPIDFARQPDLTPIKKASETVGKHLEKGAIVVYESTVYPGVTEEVCVPILEKESGLTWKKDFNVGYSPERINPGDKVHTVDKIIKVVAGDTPEVSDTLAEIYGSVITAGIHKAPTIKTAEAAKVIENTQRDLNIALMNELSIIFNEMDIDTRDVLEAAGTKWNFLKFYPGLVGGHCIGVDPYYLTYKAEQMGYHPQVILAGRRINDNMGKYVAENTVKALIKADKSVKGSKALILGFTFKEDVPDVRNTKVIDVIRELEDYGINVTVVDPWADPEEVKQEYGLLVHNSSPVTHHSSPKYDAIIFAVKHKKLLKQYSLEELRKVAADDKPVLIDIKSSYDIRESGKPGFIYWSL